MEETAKDWVARPDEAEVDRGSMTRWFVVQLADVFKLEAPPPGPPAGAVGGASTAAAPTPLPSPSPSPSPPRDGGRVDTPEVILVEDDPALAGLLEYGLRSRGYRFLIFRNGREALEALLALDPAGQHPLLLLDVDLPALDGYSILAALERERPGQYRVVFTTVHGEESEQLRGLEAGALDYLVKPISLRVALEKIRRWVGR
jgi:CheY-like chemotaxis protein